MANFTVSSAVDTMMQSSDTADIRSSIGAVDYPFTTDVIGSTVQTRNLTSITDSSGFKYQTVSVYIGSNVTSIGSFAFSYGSVTSITIAPGVTSIGSRAFAYGGPNNIIIPDTVTSIGSSAFKYGNLQSCILPINDTFTAIPSSLFNGSSLQSITIPSSITSIEANAFYSSGLATINCLATAAPTLGSSAFTNVSATSIHVPVGATGYGTTYGGLTVIADL